MKFSLSDDADIVINSYEKGGFRVSGRQLSGSQLLFSHQPPQNWPVESVDSLQASDFKPILSSHMQTVIVGTGEKQRFPPDEILLAFFAAGIGVEIMDTAAACRTFNVLVAEGREVCAALIAI